MHTLPVPGVFTPLVSSKWCASRLCYSMLYAKNHWNFIWRETYTAINAMELYYVHL